MNIDEAHYVGEFDQRGTARIWHVDGDYRREVTRVTVASPAGLAWGYIGNGPLDTARTLLTDAIGDPALAEALYLDFTEQIVDRLPRNQRFELPTSDVDQWLQWRGIVPASQQASRAEVRPLPTTDIDVLEWAQELEQREREIERWERRLGEREQRLAQAEARLAAADVARRHDDVTPAWALPSAPVADELRAVMTDTGAAIDDIAAEFGLDATWARGVLDGSITEVDIPHVQQVCEGWSCTPYSFWGTDLGRSVVHAYPPELWPQHTAPLWEWDHRRMDAGPDPPGPELGL